MAHTTTANGPVMGGGPWLTSIAMWRNCLRPVCVAPDGLTVSDLARGVRTGSNLPGMLRWGYVKFDPPLRAGGSKQPRPSTVLRPTAAGRRAHDVWSSVDGLVSSAWVARFGSNAEELRSALVDLVDQLPRTLPDVMPIAHHGLRTVLPSDPVDDGPEASKLALAELMARVLTAWAVDYESSSRVSVIMRANVLRVLGPEPLPVRDLPALAGISRAAIDMALGWLARFDLITVAPASDGRRGKQVRLTERGSRSMELHASITAEVESSWRQRFGDGLIDRVLTSAGAIAGSGTRDDSRLFEGLEPFAENWRADVAPPDVLPHFPCVLHRGGYPDGS